MNDHRHPAPDYTALSGDLPEQHHGDLRKGAYLKRRAAYQLQAEVGNSMQAGGLPITPSSRKAR